MTSWSTRRVWFHDAPWSGLPRLCVLSNDKRIWLRSWIQLLKGEVCANQSTLGGDHRQTRHHNMWASCAITPQPAVVLKVFFGLGRKKICPLRISDLETNGRSTFRRFGPLIHNPAIREPFIHGPSRRGSPAKPENQPVPAWCRSAGANFRPRAPQSRGRRPSH